MIKRFLVAGLILMGIGIIGLVWANAQIEYIISQQAELQQRGDSFLGKLGRLFSSEIQAKYQSANQAIYDAIQTMKVIVLISVITTVMGFGLTIGGAVIKPTLAPARS
ncbi:MAG TPA: hypothetical protein VGQ13_03700 [Nitrososphaera sp.]|jgi:hypothetical protein|nr:hypothetical protein [Nitrososphaera sp.]